MKKVFIINGGQVFGESNGKLNDTISQWTSNYFTNNEVEVRVTNVSEEYDPSTEADNFLWADLIVWHTPIWWFQVPFKLKQYIDEVLQLGGYGKLYKNDGRTRTNPEINYGTGGLLQGKNYMVTTTWNAPKGAFNIEGEIMNLKNVDEGILFGFHVSMKFIGLTKVDGFHFYDVMKGLTPERFDNYHVEYEQHLANILNK
ncbi:NAD(P)H-dependent oxidoreductase [Chishuiella changwenlii]|uniref:NAD(P)H-dependent oxidoreductase n=1 Tax=Chishuiella changwenlii TaxID=1434701 RepID=UPI002FD904E2